MVHTCRPHIFHDPSHSHHKPKFHSNWSNIDVIDQYVDIRLTIELNATFTNWSIKVHITRSEVKFGQVHIQRGLAICNDLDEVKAGPTSINQNSPTREFLWKLLHIDTLAPPFLNTSQSNHWPKFHSNRSNIHLRLINMLDWLSLNFTQWST